MGHHIIFIATFIFIIFEDVKKYLRFSIHIVSMVYTTQLKFF